MAAIKANDQEKLKEIEAKNQEMWTDTKKMLKQSFKPLYITMIPIIVVLAFLRGGYDKFGTIIEVPIFGGLTWFWWYLIVAMATSILFEIVYRQIRKKVKGGKQNAKTE